MRPTVLLAEDDPDMRRLLLRVLDRSGVRVVCVANGSELLHEASRNDVPGADLIVSDVRMPGIDGLAVLRRLRECSVPTPVVLITAYPDDEVFDTANRLGVLAVVPKPFDVEAFRRLVVDLVPTLW